MQHLEKRYFEVGNLGFPVIRAPMGELPGINMGMMICNDRRWPEAWRVLGLQSVELVLLGYNTPSLNMEAGGFEAHHLRVFHSHLSIQAGCYQNACFAVATAKAGTEDGCELFGHSIIVNPQGEIMAMAAIWDDELITADCDLDMCTLGRTTIFAFEKHRRPEAYGRITQQVGAVEPRGLVEASRCVNGEPTPRSVGFHASRHCSTPFRGGNGLAHPHYVDPDKLGAEHHRDARRSYDPAATVGWQCIEGLTAG